MVTKKFPIIELFGPTIQGEGALCGKRSHFVRFGGCPYRCEWCDSMHAVDPIQIKKNASWLYADQIIERIHILGNSEWVTLTGGDPVMWNLIDFATMLRPRYKVNVETEGAYFRRWVTLCDMVTVSPKGPSSGMKDKLDISILNEYYISTKDTMNFKVVVFTKEDLVFAKHIHLMFPNVPFYISVGTPQKKTEGIVDIQDAILGRMTDLAEEILKDDAFSDVTLLPQLHTLIWGYKLGV